MYIHWLERTGHTTLYTLIKQHIKHTLYTCRWNMTIVKMSWHSIGTYTITRTLFWLHSYLSSCHSAICFPGEARTSFQWRNSSADAWPQRITWPSSFFRACLFSLVSATLTEMFFIWLGSTVAVSASLKIGEQLWGFLRVLSRPRIFSPPTVIHTLAWASAWREGGKRHSITQHRQWLIYQFLLSCTRLFTQ